MARRGRKRRLDLESEYWLLLAAGVGAVQACRIVGIGRKTGYRWRAENGGVPPGRLAEDARSNRYLSLLERQRIATLRRQDLSIRTIADRLGRAPSTVSRELRRNVRPHDGGIYDADLAHARARQRARRLHPARLITDPQLRAAVQAKLELEWSPAQITAWLRTAYPQRVGWHVCHETIYQALYNPGKGGLSRQLTRRLRTGRPLRKRRRRAGQRRCRFVAPATLIEHRPPAAHERARVGDWEGDLILGRGGRSAIATLVDRRTRYLRLVHLPGNRTADTVRDALIETFRGIPDIARWTLTWTRARRWRTTNRSRHCYGKGCSSLIPGVRGSAAATKTPTACCGSTFRKTPISPPTPRRTYAPSKTASTPAPASDSAGAHPQNSSPPP